MKTAAILSRKFEIDTGEIMEPQYSFNIDRGNGNDSAVICEFRHCPTGTIFLNRCERIDRDSHPEFDWGSYSSVIVEE